MRTYETRNSVLSLLLRASCVLALTAFAVVVAARSVWLGLWIAPVCVLAGLLTLPSRPAISVVCFGYALVLAWYFAFVTGPIFAMLSLVGVLLVAIGLWYALPGRWVCPDCRAVLVRLPNPIPARCPDCERVTCGGATSRCPDCHRVDCAGNVARERLAWHAEVSGKDSGVPAPPLAVS